MPDTVKRNSPIDVTLTFKRTFIYCIKERCEKGKVFSILHHLRILRASTPSFHLSVVCVCWRFYSPVLLIVKWIFLRMLFLQVRVIEQACSAGRQPMSQQSPELENTIGQFLLYQQRKHIGKHLLMVYESFFSAFSCTGHLFLLPLPPLRKDRSVSRSHNVV